MLDGITLLHTFEHTTGIWTAIGLWVAFALFAILTLYAWVLWVNKRGIKGLAFTLTITLLCILALGFAFATRPTTEILYKVTIDQSVSYRDFTEYYEVVDIEGEIYTIRNISEIEKLPMPINPVENTITESEPTWDSSAVG
jgi:hypothetical protein